jgi:hypothetical protein
MSYKEWAVKQVEDQLDGIGNGCKQDRHIGSLLAFITVSAAGLSLVVGHFGWLPAIGAFLFGWPVLFLMCAALFRQP